MLALLLLLPDPAELLRALGEAEIEIRQRAAAELYRRGDELWDVLVQARRDATDIEVRARLDEIVRRLWTEARIRSFGGGPPAGDFSLSLRSDRFHGSGRFRLTVEVMNVGSAPRVFPGIGAWEVEGPDSETRVPGAEARLTVRKVIGSAGFHRTRRNGFREAAPAPLRLRPGESARYAYVLDAQDLANGDYELRVDVGELRSNPTRLMIRKGEK